MAASAQVKAKREDVTYLHLRNPVSWTGWLVRGTAAVGTYGEHPCRSGPVSGPADECRAWTLAQPAYRMDAGTVAAMTPAERFAAPQAPPEVLAGQARTGQARTGRAAPQPDQVSRPEAAAARPPQQMDTAAVEFEEFLSRSVCQLVTSVGWAPTAALGLTQRPGKRQSRPLCVATSRAGPRA